MVRFFRACRFRSAAGMGSALGVCLFVAGFGPRGMAQVRKENDPPITRIRAADLMYGKSGPRVQIIGLLGHPLQEAVTIRGTWVRPEPTAKDYSLRFRVTEVDGKRLEPAVEFHRYLVSYTQDPRGKRNEPPKPKEGEVWELRGMETGRFRGLPSSLGGDYVAQPFFGFVTDFVYVSYERVAANGVQK